MHSIGNGNIQLITLPGKKYSIYQEHCAFSVKQSGTVQSWSECKRAAWDIHYGRSCKDIGYNNSCRESGMSAPVTNSHALAVLENL